MSTIVECKRCGTCCLQGGPALHSQDRALLLSGHLIFDDLITVRQGELALQPLALRPAPVPHEFLKLRGHGSTWACASFDAATKGCLRYAHRPVACRLLDCVNPGPLLAIAGQDILSRFDCVEVADPLLALIHEHEYLCPCSDLEHIYREGAALSADLLRELTSAVRCDLAFRARVVRDHHLSLNLELFYFGRPHSQLIRSLGVQTVHTAQGIRLHQ